MRFLETGLADAFVIELELAADERGFFARSFCEIEFAEHGLPSHFVQSNVSFNHRTGTTRGMHWQAGIHAEGKLIRCTSGSIFDVIVDLRTDRGSLHRFISVELSAQNRRMLYVPKGFAHGFQTLENDTEVFYQMSTAYAAEAARGFRWDDPSLRIPWPRTPSSMSDRDRSWPVLEDLA